MKTTCLHCDEEVTETEQEYGQQANVLEEGVFRKQWVHRECRLREVVGSVRHQQKRCRCFNKHEECDDEHLTHRQQAIEAVRYFEKHSAKLVKRLDDA